MTRAAPGLATALRVEQPGLLTTIQDRGRPGHRAWGVPPGGAADSFALAAANLLLGNDPGAAALECTLLGPTLVAERAIAVAITGAALGPLLNGRPAPVWEVFFMSVGDVLELPGGGIGCRAYVGVAGGVAAEVWLGSRSTCLTAGRGGLEGRPLQAGDRLPVAGPPSRPPVLGRRLAVEMRAGYGRSELRVIPGPHPGGGGSFEGAFLVTDRCDRMGCRLERVGQTDGERTPPAASGILSVGVSAGCLQVPSPQTAILLLAEHQVTGGYPVAATVISADLPLAAQLAPGDRVSFAPVTLAEAAEARRQAASRLRSLIQR